MLYTLYASHWIYIFPFSNIIYTAEEVSIGRFGSEYQLEIFVTFVGDRLLVDYNNKRYCEGNTKVFL